jgi:hypothetical protein
MSYAIAKEPTFIDPHRLYAIRSFWSASGISPTRIRVAKRRGIELKTVDVGKRKFVRGADGIAFIEALAAAGGDD